MPRNDEIKEEIHDRINRLLELYEQTDPRRGEESESEKLHAAQEAFSHWWYLYAKLMAWAQCHIMGYEIARFNPPCYNFLEELRGSAIGKDSHELEYLGARYIANIPNEDYPPLDNLHEKLDEEQPDCTGFDDATMRRIIVRLLLSTSTESSVWRFPLAHSLQALNYGEVPDLVKPSRSRRRGRPFQLDQARSSAIEYVWFDVGRGLKKHLARAKVANGLAVSEETLRDWEKNLQKDDLLYFDWQCAWLAGFITENPDIDPHDEFDDLPCLGLYSAVRGARAFLDLTQKRTPLETLRKRLRTLQS